METIQDLDQVQTGMSVANDEMQSMSASGHSVQQLALSLRPASEALMDSCASLKTQLSKFVV